MNKQKLLMVTMAGLLGVSLVLGIFFLDDGFRGGMDIDEKEIEANTTTNPNATATISHEEWLQLKVGMSIGDMTNIIGGEPHQIVDSKEGVLVYSWPQENVEEAVLGFKVHNNTGLMEFGEWVGDFK